MANEHSPQLRKGSGLHLDLRKIPVFPIRFGFGFNADPDPGI
jgi:hypothetical protein